MRRRAGWKSAATVRVEAATARLVPPANPLSIPWNTITRPMYTAASRDHDRARRCRRRAARSTAWLGHAPGAEFHARVRDRQLGLRLPDIRNPSARLGADAVLFRSGWFVESVAAELAVLFVLRTRRPFSPIAQPLGLIGLPALLLAVLAGTTALYVAATDLAKRAFYGRPRAGAGLRDSGSPEFQYGRPPPRCSVAERRRTAKPSSDTRSRFTSRAVTFWPSCRNCCGSRTFR